MEYSSQQLKELFWQYVQQATHSEDVSAVARFIQWLERQETPAQAERVPET